LTDVILNFTITRCDGRAVASIFLTRKVRTPYRHDAG